MPHPAPPAAQRTEELPPGSGPGPWGIALLAAMAAVFIASAVAAFWVGVILPHNAHNERYGALSQGVGALEAAYDVTLVDMDLDASPKTITVRTAEGTTQTCLLPSVEDYEQRLPLADCAPE